MDRDSHLNNTVKLYGVADAQGTGLFYLKYEKNHLKHTELFVHLIEGLCLIWGSLKTGFTVMPTELFQLQLLSSYNGTVFIIL